MYVGWLKRRNEALKGGTFARKQKHVQNDNNFKPMSKAGQKLQHKQYLRNVKKRCEPNNQLAKQSITLNDHKIKNLKTVKKFHANHARVRACARYVIAKISK